MNPGSTEPSKNPALINQSVNRQSPGNAVLTAARWGESEDWVNVSCEHNMVCLDWSARRSHSLEGTVLVRKSKRNQSKTEKRLTFQKDRQQLGTDRHR